MRGLLKAAPELKDSVGIVAPPVAKKKVVELSGEMFGIAQTSRNREAAAKLLAYLTTRDVVIKYNQLDDNIPGLKSAMDSDYVKSNPFVSQFVEIAKVGGRCRNTRGGARFRRSSVPPSTRSISAGARPATEDKEEAVRAFLERREPRYRGR